MEKRDPKITLIELAPTSKGDLFSPIVKDVYSIVKIPSRAIPLLNSVVKNEGYKDVKNIDTRYNKQGRIEPSDLERIFSSDYILASSIIRTLPQTLELAREYKSENPQGKFITGGHSATFLPEMVLNNGADIVVRGEGEKTLPILLDALNKNNNLEDIIGISYKSENGEFIHNPAREFLSEEELDGLPAPFYPEETKTKRGVLETARGCPYGCEYCGVTKFFGRRTRRKSNDKILEDLENLMSNGINKLFFSDDHFAMRKEKTKDLLRKISNNKHLRKISYSAQLSINSAFKNDKQNEIDYDFLRLLKKANFGYVFLGIESLNDATLEEWGKPATAERNIKAVNAFRNQGILVHGMMMIGSDSDTNETLNYTSDWCKNNLDSVQYFAPIPIPGTPFGDRMMEQGRVIPDNFPNDYHLFDGQYVIINPIKFRPIELQNDLFKMHEDFYRFKGNFKNIRSSPKSLKKTLVHVIAPRIIKSIKKDSQTKDYLERLEKL